MPIGEAVAIKTRYYQQPKKVTAFDLKRKLAICV